MALAVNSLSPAKTTFQKNLPRRGAGRTTVKRPDLLDFRALNFLYFLPCFLKTVILSFLAGETLPLKPACLPDRVLMVSLRWALIPVAAEVAGSNVPW